MDEPHFSGSMGTIWQQVKAAARSCQHLLVDPLHLRPAQCCSVPLGSLKKNLLTLAPMTLQEEASRYALLRRITPALRHHMAGEFQPIGMMAALLERRLQQASPDMASLRENCSAIGHLSRKAASTCSDLMGWLAPRPQASVPVSEGITECVSLLSTSLRFKGFALSSQAPELSAQVSTSALRNVLTAAILAQSDAATATADLQVSAHDQGAQVLIELSLTPVARPADNLSGEGHRALSWDDVAALAEAAAVGLARTAQGVQLTLAVVRSP